MLVLLLLVAVIGLFYYYAVRPMSYWKRKGIKQTNPIWLFGDSTANIFRRQNLADLIKDVYNTDKNARYIGFYQFNTPTLLIRDPDLLKQITVKEFDHFTDHRQFIPSEADPLWGKNLLSLEGQKWKEMRPILSPAFTTNKMKTIYSLISDCAESLVTFYTKKNQDIIDVDMKDVATRFANDVIATAAFGVKVDSLENPKNEFYMMGKHVTNFTTISKALKLAGISIFPNLYKFINVQAFDDPSRQFFVDLIDNTLNLREKEGIVRPDMLHLLMEAKKGVNQKKENDGLVTDFKEAASGKGKITNTDITAQALIFFFAGFESVSSMITFMAYELAIHPNIQQRLREEILKAFKECNGKLTYEAVLNMKYLDMVISETMRKWPNFPGTDRICTKNFVIKPQLPDEKSVVIEKGTLLELPLIAIHYDPKYFPNPERFDPERFSDENKDTINPYTYFPFGLGPRICIGSRFALMEGKVLFTNLLLNYEIIPVTKTKIPIKLSKIHFSVHAEGKVYLGFKKLMR